MRFGGAATMAIALCALSAPFASSSGEVHVVNARTPTRAVERMHSPPPSSGRGGLNAEQLARLSRKNARRKRRR